MGGQMFGWLTGTSKRPMQSAYLLLYEFASVNRVYLMASKEEQHIQNKSKEISEVFNYYDREHNGTIKRDDIGKVMRSSGFAPTNKQIDDIKNDLIGKQKETISKAELEAILLNYLHKSNELAKSPEEKLKDAFLVLDREKKGTVSSGELRHVLTSIGETLSQQEVTEMFQRAGVEAEKDTNLDFDKFKTLFLFQKKE